MSRRIWSDSWHTAVAYSNEDADVFSGLSSGSGLGLAGLWLRRWLGMLRSRPYGKPAGTARPLEAASAWVRAGR
jgi:hypothetical protein